MERTHDGGDLAAAPPDQDPGSGQHKLKTRHMTMIALGGTIGAGLFVGSSEVIHNTGPLTFVTYGLTGLLVVIVMRMISEMATTSPLQGSFVDYARMALGGLAGFTTGWLYWYFWVIVVGFEAVVAGQLLDDWIPVPTWIIAFVVLAVMTLVNLLSVRAFGETEYWFAGIKAVAVVSFIVLASLFVFGVWPGRSVDFSNFTAGGDVLPNGVFALFAGVAVVIFSMVGGEIVAIAAADSDDPKRSVRKAASTVAIRVLLFFVLSTLLLVVVVPWTSIKPGVSPFITALDGMGIPGASNILTLIILTAILSLLNSGLYTASRLTVDMAKNGDAPRWFAKTNNRGVSVRSILGCTAVGYGCVLMAALWPDTVFSFLINATGALMAFVYISIGISQIRLRRRWESEGVDIPVKMWFFPWLSIVFVAALLGVLVAMWIQEGTRFPLLQGLVAVALLAVIYGLKTLVGRRRKSKMSTESPVAQ